MGCLRAKQLARRHGLPLPGPRHLRRVRDDAALPGPRRDLRDLHHPTGRRRCRRCLQEPPQRVWPVERRHIDLQDRLGKDGTPVGLLDRPLELPGDHPLRHHVCRGAHCDRCICGGRAGQFPLLELRWRLRGYHAHHARLLLPYAQVLVLVQVHR
eukprot:scaffold48_cov311-Pinguiococcus_pyrenoidosus.AAC.215